jgi:hypothetical protein
MNTNDIVTLTRALNREQMMQVLKENNVDVIGTTESFDGGEHGIWINGEGDDYRLNYWTENYNDYTFGIENSLNELVEECGWFFEWYDAGTLMCYPS